MVTSALRSLAFGPRFLAAALVVTAGLGASCTDEATGRPSAVALTSATYPPIDDGQIAELADVMDVQQIRTARLGFERSQSPAVRAFAARVLQDDTAAERAILGKHEPLQPTLLESQFESSAREKRAWVSTLQGSDFDRGLVATEVGQLTRQLDWLDHILIPGAHGAPLRAGLTQRRDVIARRLSQAMDLSDQLGAPR